MRQQIPFNKALLGKSNWHYANENNAFWREVGRETGIPRRAMGGMKFVYGSIFSPDGRGLQGMFLFPLDQ